MASPSSTDFWCYTIEWAAKICSLTANDLITLKIHTPEERIIGHTPDISENAHLPWCGWIWYREQTQFLEENLCLGKWLGVATNVGQALTCWVLTRKGAVIA
jgi:hypothetical protein